MPLGTPADLRGAARPGSAILNAMMTNTTWRQIDLALIAVP
jgi:hypothetical protein